jgi:hypothetical protein
MSIVQWLQDLADSVQDSPFLEYQVNTGYFGIPIATFGLVTIATAVFVHATFQDELQALGTRAYDATQAGLQQATNMVDQAQEVVAEQANRVSDVVSDSLNAGIQQPPPPATEEKEEEAKTNDMPAVDEKEADEDGREKRQGGGKKKKRRSYRRRRSR